MMNNGFRAIRMNKKAGFYRNFHIWDKTWQT